MSFLATTLLLAQAVAPVAAPASAQAREEPAAALQPVWKQFDQLKIPAASRGEDSSGLEDVLARLRQREERCVEQLPQGPALRARRAELAAALDRSGADLVPGAVAARLASCADAVDGIAVSIPPEAAPGASFPIRLSAKGSGRALSNALVCAVNALSTLRVASFDVSRDGWEAEGTLTLLPTASEDLLPDAAPAQGRDGRRSGELRVRIAAARPGVVACEAQLVAAGLAGLDQLAARVEEAEKLRASDTLMRPALLLLFGLSSLPGTAPTRIAAEERGTRIEATVAPYRAGVELRRRLRAPGSVVRVVAERAEPGRLVLVLVLERTPPLHALLAAPTPPQDAALARLVALVRAADAGATEAARTEVPALVPVAKALREAAENFVVPLDDARELVARRAKILTDIDRQGIVLEPKAAAERVRRCGAELAGLPSVGAVSTLSISGRKETDGPHPWTCVRNALRSSTLVRFEQSVKAWKISASVRLLAQGVAKGTSTLPAVPAAPPALKPAATAAAKAWRGQLADLQTFLAEQRKRLDAAELGTVAALEGAYDAAGLIESEGELAAFEQVVFGGDDAARPPWMDFSARGANVDLNLSPREKGEELLGRLEAVGCKETKRKVAGDSLRVSVTCAAP